MSKIIGITGSILSNENDGVFSGYERAYVNDDYINSISKSGGIPVILPIVDNESAIKEQVSMTSAIVLSGGYDIDPIYYGEEISQKYGRIFPRRDKYELAVIKYAMEMKKPILGICRGLQILNVALGGTLYQDLSLTPNCYIKHSQSAKPHETTHSIKTENSSIMNEIVGNSIRVNSFHHLAVKTLGEKLKATAIAPDGVIEAIECRESGLLMLGVQFHPEMMFEYEEFAKKIFKYFISNS